MLNRSTATETLKKEICFLDCPEKTNYGCKCNSYKPTIDILQSCPKHGHLYQSGGILNPSNQQRYNQDPNLQQQIPDQVSTSADRLKRQVTNNFPKKIQDILPGLRSNNQISKVPTNEENSQNRNSEIMKMNFGVDPAEDIEELLRPKPLGFEQSVQSEPDQVKSTMPDFILKINPKLQEARSNIRSGISKIVNKARLDAIMRNHMIQKRSTEFDQSELSDVYFDDPYNFERSYETLSSAESDEKIEESDNHKPQFDSDPVNADEHDLDQSNSDRIRKHCDRCGELAQKFPCPSCGGMSLERSQPQYFEMRQGNLIPYIPGNVVQTLDHSFQPRYVFDRFGHRYLENNGKLKLVGPKQIDDDVTVGSYYKDPDVYSELKDILHRNSETIHSTNYKVGGDHLVQPMNLAHATDAIRFIQELTQKHNNQYNEDYYSNGESYEVGSSRNYPAKRSFKIIPLVEDEDDGSVLVKIAPTGGSQTKLKNEKLKSKDYSKLYGVDSVQSKPSFEKNVISGEKTKANFEKFVRDGKKYQILALSENGSVEGSVGSDEDLAILKYIYAVNRKEQSDENASTKISDENYSKNNDTQLKT